MQLIPTSQSHLDRRLLFIGTVRESELYDECFLKPKHLVSNRSAEADRVMILI